jgi:hypothetical protein
MYLDWDPIARYLPLVWVKESLSLEDQLTFVFTFGIAFKYVFKKHLASKRINLIFLMFSDWFDVLI